MKTKIPSSSVVRLSGGLLALLAGACVASADTSSTTPSRETPPPSMDTPSKSTPDTTLNYDSTTTTQTPAPGHPRESAPPDMDTPSTSKTTDMADTTGPYTPINASDERTLNKAAKLGSEEVLVSKVAADRAINPQVRAFAAEMVTAHTAANAELKALAVGKGATLTPRDPVDDRKEEQKWMDKKGDDIDEDYLKAAISNHKDTIDVLEKAADSKDPQISGWANKMLPVVKGHLEHAKQLKKTVT